MNAGADAPFVDWRETGETFVFMAHEWDVDAAKRILQVRVQSGRHARAGVISVADLSPMLQRTTLHEDGRTSISMGVHVDWAMAATDAVDVTVPVVLAWSRSNGHRSAGMIMMIDGWTRLARATLLGLTVLPAVCLTKAESKKTWL